MRCAEPGCSEQPCRAGARYCEGHSWKNRTPELRREYDRARYLARQGDRLGVMCLICDAGPFVKLGTHTAMLHNVSGREYRRMFPGAHMTHPSLRQNFEIEAYEKGWRPGSSRRRTCRRGHLFREPNVVPLRGGTGRTCRRCAYEARRARMKRISEASGTKLCECGCGTVIPRIGLNGHPRRFVRGHHNKAGPAV